MFGRVSEIFVQNNKEIFEAISILRFPFLISLGCLMGKITLSLSYLFIDLFANNFSNFDDKFLYNYR